MGRRKQTNPVRVGPSFDEQGLAATSSTSPSSTTTSSSSAASLPSSTPPPKLSPSTPSATFSKSKTNGFPSSNGPTAKKPKTDFSIKSHLEASAASAKPTTSFNPSLSPHSLTSALKAYETLLNELNRQPNGLKPGPLLQLTKQVDKLASRDGKRDPATETALDLRVKKPSPSTHSSTLPSTHSSTLKKSSFQSDNTDSLRKLSSLVGKAGTSMNASMAAVVKSPTNFIKDDNDPCKIFTCLQCFERFPGMQELVDHMSKTKHHFNQPPPSSSTTKPSTTTPSGTNGFLDPHSLLRQTLLSSQKIQ